MHVRRDHAVPRSDGFPFPDSRYRPCTQCKGSATQDLAHALHARSALDTRIRECYIRTMDQFTQALNAFVAKLQAAQDEYRAKRMPNLPKETYSADPNGRKYVRIVCQSGSSRSVYCFVERSTGHILKSASWKAPAEGERGSIYNADPLMGCGPHGVAYMNVSINGFDGKALPQANAWMADGKRGYVRASEPHTVSEPETDQVALLKSLGVEPK